MRMRGAGLAALSFVGMGLAGMALLASPAGAAEKLTFLLSAPAVAPAFVPFQLAIAKGYFRDADLDVTFQSTTGGAEAAKQVGVGNADLGAAQGDTPIFVRQNGIPVKGVAVLGKGSFAQVIVRADSGINSLADLKGKTIGVVAFTESSYYALQAVMAHFKLGKSDVNVQALGRAGMLDLVAVGKTQGLVNVPDNAVDLEARSVPVRIFPIDQVFPAMAIGIMASETTIAKRPQMIRAFVHAMLRALQYQIDDPDQAAKDYVAAMPMHAGKEAYFTRVIKLYNQDVYRPERPGIMGAFDRDRVAKVQKFYLDSGLIRAALPLDDIFTNQFVE